MSLVYGRVEIGPDDLIHVRAGERVFEATVTGVEFSGTVLTVRCEITGEVPAWVIEQRPPEG